MSAQQRRSNVASAIKWLSYTSKLSYLSLIWKYEIEEANGQASMKSWNEAYLRQ